MLGGRACSGPYLAAAGRRLAEPAGGERRQGPDL